MLCSLWGDRLWYHNPEDQIPDYLLVSENRVLKIYELKETGIIGE
jgi:hypothetical protein